MAELYPWLESTWQALQLQLKQQRLPHGLMCTGLAGIGKSALLQHLAQALLCQHPQQAPCGQCRSCQLYAAHSHPDLLAIQPEQGKQISIETVRQITRMLSETAHQRGARVVIIEQAEQLTENASNALLKTLEEPGENTYLLLSATSATTLLPTIVSRCQVMTLSVPDTAITLPWLQQTYPQASAAHLRLNGGSPLRTQQFLEQQLDAACSAFVHQLNAWFKGNEQSAQLAASFNDNHPYALDWFYLYCRDLQISRAGGQQLVFATHAAVYQSLLSDDAVCQRLQYCLRHWRMLKSRINAPGINRLLQYQGWLAGAEPQE